jgi:hypothetical protein
MISFFWAQEEMNNARNIGNAVRDIIKRTLIVVGQMYKHANT